MKINMIITLVCAVPYLLFPTGVLAATALAHPPIVLMDHDGNELSLDSHIPYSPRKTCGECHDYDAITNAYHFQQGRTDAHGNIAVRDDLDPKNPWLISRGMYGKW